MSSVVFPLGTTGYNLDILARTPLWQAGLNYKYFSRDFHRVLLIRPQSKFWLVHPFRHGTGHGVGSYLNVHEGPHLISYYPREKDPVIKVCFKIFFQFRQLENEHWLIFLTCFPYCQEHYTSSIEPGYYEEGAFGIRIENLAVVVKTFTRGDVDWFTFEPVTFVPLSVSEQEKKQHYSLSTFSQHATNSLSS